MDANILPGSAGGNLEGIFDPEPALLLKAPPGLGKTYIVLDELTNLPDGLDAIYVAPTHELAKQVFTGLQERGVFAHYWRKGPDESDECPQQQLVEYFRCQGYDMKYGPCKLCQRSHCAYREQFVSNAARCSRVLVITSWHLRRDNLWDLQSTCQRKLLILDEDAMRPLIAPVELSPTQLQNFCRDISNLHNLLNDTDITLSLADFFRESALALLAATCKAENSSWVDSDTVLTAEQTELFSDNDCFKDLLVASYELARQQKAPPNLYGSLKGIISQPCKIRISSDNVSWFPSRQLPLWKKIITLDATAEPAIVKAVLKRPLEIIEAPKIRTAATIWQIMDKISTRSGVTRELTSQVSWTSQLIREVARRHSSQSILCVTFKRDEDAITAAFAAEGLTASVIHYGALRGLNAYQDFDVGLILGRPMPNEMELELLAVGAFGMEVLDTNLNRPPLRWALEEYNTGLDTWECRVQRYDESRWQSVWRHVVVGELMQAIGRLRPLTNPATIYVATNEPLPDDFEITGVYAGEIFPRMVLASKRNDFARSVQRYAEAWKIIEATGQKATNAAICRKLGIKKQNGQRFRKLACFLLPKGQNK